MRSKFVLLTVTLVVSLARPVLAQDVWMSEEQWEEESGDHFHGLGRYVVETNLWGPLWAAATTYSPTGRQAGYNQNSGSNSVTIDTSLCGQNDIIWDGEEGDWTIKIEFDHSGDVHQSGSWWLPKLGAGRFAYRLDYIWSIGFVARYVRCNAGSKCTQMDVLRSTIRNNGQPVDSFPLYLMMKLIWTNPNACAGFNIEQVPICVADVG
jgi:hypothetical protein